MTLTKIQIAIDSNRSHLEKRCKGIVAQSTMTGAMNIVTAASASHHINQVTRESEKFSLLARMNSATVMLELTIVVGANEMMANFATPEGPANVWRPFDQPLIRHAPANAARR